MRSLKNSLLPSDGFKSRNSKVRAERLYDKFIDHLACGAFPITTMTILGELHLFF